MGQRLRVLVLTPDFPPGKGGIQLLAHRLVTHFSAADVRVLTLDLPGAAAVDGALGAEVTRVPGLHRDRRMAGIAALNAAAVVEARRFRAHVVLNLHVVTGPGAAGARRLLGVPYVQYIHADEVLDRPRVTRLAVGRAAAVVGVSDFARELALGYGASPDRLHVVHNGVDPPRPPVEQRAAEPTIVTVSRLADWFKGHDVMLRAMPAILERVPSARWVVVGEGPLLGTYEAMAAELGVAERVSFVGGVDDAERDRWLDRAHVFVMASRLSDRGGGEGFGIAYLEAGAHRLPVVAGAVAGALAAVEDGVTGLLIDPTDVAAVADAVGGLLLDPARAEALGRGGERRAQASSWTSSASEVERLLEAVAGAGAPRTARS